jgi:septum formation protein
MHLIFLFSNILLYYLLLELLLSPGYSGSHVATVGSVVVTNLTTGKRLGSLDKAEVYFHDIPDEVIENLIDEGVVFRVAGGLLLEHPLTLPFVEAVVGSSDSVMGISKDLANKLIQDAL